MATELAIPFVGSAIATSQQYRDRYRWSIPDGIDAPVSLVSGAGSGAVADGGGGTTITIQNVSAYVQGARYELTAGPLSLPVSANGGGANRYDIVCLTYDAAHSPGVYARIVEGTPGAGLPALTHSATGVWDFPLYHYQKTPAGAITGLTDRRRYVDVYTGEVSTSAVGTGTNDVWPPAAARKGARMKYDGALFSLWEFDGTSWILLRGIMSTGSASNFTGPSVIGTFGAAFPANMSQWSGFRAQVHGNVSHSGTVTVGLQWRIDNAAGTIVLDPSAFTWSTAIAGDRTWWAELEVQATSGPTATNLKAVMRTVSHVEATGKALMDVAILGTPAIDTTTAHNLVLCATCSVASASNVMRTLSGTLERTHYR